MTRTLVLAVRGALVALDVVVVAVAAVGSGGVAGDAMSVLDNGAESAVDGAGEAVGGSSRCGALVC